MVNSTSKNYLGYKYASYILIAICLILVLSSTLYFLWQHKNLKPQITAKEAIFNFRKSDFNKTKNIKLYGDVSFWWDTLITPSAISHKIEIKPDTFIPILKNWDEISLNGIRLPATGYATYNFKIIVPETNVYALKIWNTNSVFNIWINGIKHKTIGKVGTSKAEEKPTKHRQEFFFSPINDTIDIVIQVSNFHSANGGLGHTILFGKADSIMKYKKRTDATEMSLFGILSILFIYHLIIFYYRRNDRSILLFSLLCLWVLLRLITTGEKHILELFPNLRWDIEMRIEYLSLILTSVTIGWYFHELFPNELTTRFMKRYTILLIPFTLIILFTAPVFFSQFLAAIQIIIFAGAISVIGMNLLAVKRQREYALTALVGYLMLFLFAINDLLFYYKVIDTSYLVPIGYMFLILSQALIASRKTSVAFVVVEDLSQKLEKYNLELEERVNDRTQKIEEQKAEIEHKVNDLNNANNQLKKLLQFKKDVTSMMVHDLKNPLNNIMGFLLLKTDISKYKEIIYSSGWTMQNLILNILDVEKYQSTQLRLSIQKISLFDIVNQASLNNHYPIQSNNIKFENLVPKQLLVDADQEIIGRVFSNVISNATKYNNTNGLIRVSTRTVEKENKNYHYIEIYNTGDQIPIDMLNSVFDKYEQEYEQKGTYSFSTGIGLTYCKMAVEAHSGEIGILQEGSIGVSFWFTLPIL